MFRNLSGWDMGFRRNGNSGFRLRAQEIKRFAAVIEVNLVSDNLPTFTTCYLTCLGRRNFW